MKLLALSATIPNIHQFAKWIESIHKKTVKVVVEENRPVPLHFSFHFNNQVIDDLHAIRKVRGFKPNKLVSLINYVRQRDGLPCIYFVFGRKRAEFLAAELYNQTFLTKDETVQITALYESLLVRFELTHERSARDMFPLVTRGIAFHHAGMLPTLKEVIERLFTSRLLKVIFTTETFALGINMPSRSVIFDELRKFYGTYIRDLKTRDFYQMAGRAGRRGIDDEGFVYTRLNPARTRIENVRRIIYGKPENVNSQFNASYATVLNLYEKYRDKLFEIYPYSFHYYQAGAQNRREALRLLEAKLNLLKEFGCIGAGALTAKGQFAKAVYGYELLLSELYAEGAFERLDERGLGIIVIAAVFEPRKNQQVKSLSKEASDIAKTCDAIMHEVRRKEIRNRVYPFSKPPYFNLSKPMEAWLGGTDFARVLQMTDTDEGELVRYFRMAIQILREIKDAPISPRLSDRITNTIRLINRDVIDAEKQLREG